MIGLSWAGIWADHDSMTFVGFDGGKKKAFFCFIFFSRHTVYFVVVLHARARLCVHEGALSTHRSRILLLAVSFFDREAAVGKIVALKWQITTTIYFV